MSQLTLRQFLKIPQNYVKLAVFGGRKIKAITDIVSVDDNEIITCTYNTIEKYNVNTNKWTNITQYRKNKYLYYNITNTSSSIYNLNFCCLTYHKNHIYLYNNNGMFIIINLSTRKTLRYAPLVPCNQAKCVWVKSYCHIFLIRDNRYDNGSQWYQSHFKWDDKLKTLEEIHRFKKTEIVFSNHSLLYFSKENCILIWAGQHNPYSLYKYNLKSHTIKKWYHSLYIF